MTFRIFIFMIVAFVVIDDLVRRNLRWFQARNERLGGQNRLNPAMLPAVQRPILRAGLPSLAEAEDVSCFEYPDEGGVFIADGHAWVWIEPDGHVRIGVDDFTRQAMGSIGEVLLPEPGLEVRRGDPLFSFKRDAEVLRILAPVSGQVQGINGCLVSNPSRVSSSPYRYGWICRMASSALNKELAQLRIGRAALDWRARETEQLLALRQARPDMACPLPWAALEQAFFTREAAQA
ncbi:MAG: glycine cleavage system protein H [Holophaga sp.]|nr:glycine cleavage system protein H [Holophaga sp.]